ncbi:MAG: cryptochrome/photolyase family protein, partial [Phycisphaerae bacterium]
FFWGAETRMNCISKAVAQTRDDAYAHHIQRLMVTGNFALIAGINPRLISDWYLAMYVDAVDWVTLPNTLGMVMHADGGVVGTKPYAASGKYISRMSNYCKGCQYDPGQRHGDQACPFTAFYWDFLIRNEKRLKQNHRMAMILKNVQKMSADEKKRIGQTTQRLRSDMGIDTSAPEPS